MSDAHQVESPGWTPFVVGAGIGLLNAASMWLSKRPLGITGAFEQTTAMASEKLFPDAVKTHIDAGGEEPAVTWESALVGGVMIGSFLAARTAGERAPSGNPPAWEQRYGSERWPRLAAAFAGGALLMYGARAAKGCTSVSGLVAGGVLFGAGMGLLGLCPGTSVAALGEGSADAGAGVLGMLAGATVFVLTHGRVAPLLDKGNFGEKTLPELTKTSSVPWLGLLSTAAMGSLALSSRSPSSSPSLPSHL